MTWNDVLKELIKATPYGGFAIIALIIVNMNANASRKVLKQSFDQALKEIRGAYEKSAEDSRKLVTMFANKLAGGKEKSKEVG